MKHFLTLVSMMVVVSLALGACNMGTGLGPGAAGLDATEPPATEAPTEPGIVPIDLAGPPMAVGSFYAYVDGSVLAAVPGGPFTMGFNNFFDSQEHQVTVSDFWIYTNEVTNEQYDWCVAVGKCTPPDPVNNPEFQNFRYANFPVIGVNYQQAVDYCAFVNGRLPTEAEWEKAARGPESNIFPWGESAPVCDLLNFNFCNGKSLKVKSYPDGVSYYGLFDMSGNVKEWTADYYKPDYDLASSTDPLGPELGQKRSVRSSSFADSADFAFAAHRFSLNPIDSLPDLGFRCVIGDPTFFAPYCQGLALYGADINGTPDDPIIPVVSDDCVQPNLSAIQDECGGTWTKVTIDPWPEPAGYVLDIQSSAACNGDRPQTTCTGNGDLTYTPSTCEVTPPSNEVPTCLPGYSPEPDPNDPSQVICKGQGPGVNCPEGFELNPLLSCCTAVNPGPHEYGFCVGFENNGRNCYNNPGDPPQPDAVSLHVSPPEACPPPPEGDDSSCVTVCDPYWPYTCTCN
jgi:formylglycine-generating enzyme required for sulfatase activity